MDFLLALLFNIKSDKYYYLYNIYKKQKANQSVCNSKIYQVDVKNVCAASINNFIGPTK